LKRSRYSTISATEKCVTNVTPLKRLPSQRRGVCRGRRPTLARGACPEQRSYERPDYIDARLMTYQVDKKSVAAHGRDHTFGVMSSLKLIQHFCT